MISWRIFKINFISPKLLTIKIDLFKIEFKLAFPIYIFQKHQFNKKLINLFQLFKALVQITKEVHSVIELNVEY
jgi:hypothetical protein